MQRRLTLDYGDDVLFSSGLTRGKLDSLHTGEDHVRTR
jgi:hypothetical protein